MGTHRRNMSLESLFGPEILTKGGVEPTATALAGKKHIMVYFSAHWCPPCRGYTPQLSEAYANSSKQDETAIFFALPYADRDKKTELSEKYGVRGIPTLVLLDGDGNLAEGNIRGNHANYL